MSESDSSISSHDEQGDVIMGGTQRTYSYKISFDLYYDHTYEREDPDPEAVELAADAEHDPDANPEDSYYEGQAVSCADPACECTGYEEPPLTAEEVDDFLREPYCGEKPRYYYYCTSLLEHLMHAKMNCSVRDVTYANGGKLRCVLTITQDGRKKRPSVARLRHLIDEIDLYNCIYAGGPGNEAIIPTMHEYRYIVMSTLAFEETHKERGRIDFRGHYEVEAI